MEYDIFFLYHEYMNYGLFWGRYNLVSERTGFEYFGYVGSG